MKKKEYIKPEVVVEKIKLPTLLYTASQEVRDDNVSFAPEDETTIGSDDDFI